jgi:release factor glutamine methyltransferase
VAAARERLRRAGLSDGEAEASARLLAQHVLGWDAARLLSDGEEAAPADFGPRYDALVSRRAAREPAAYIVGHQEFWGLDFEVSPAVLIPRPSTELIVEAGVELLRGRDTPLAIADACTGCGCVAVALAKAFPSARVIATDISPAALQVASRNARRHGVADRVRFAQGDVLEGHDGPFDVIAANPPYVRSIDRPGLQPEVREHEPDLALYGGAEGRDIIDRVVSHAVPRLTQFGYLVMEFGFGQDPYVEELIAKTAGLTMVDIRRDFQGIARVAVVRRT